MADLGKVAIIPRGNYVPAVQYEKLDLVYHNFNTYLSLKDTAAEPADDGVNWMLIAEGVNIATAETPGKVKPDGRTITVDEDGTLHGASQVPAGVTYVDIASGEGGTLPEAIPVNADTLGGQAPTYYAAASGLTAVAEAVEENTERIGQFSKPNILINGCMAAPINQRGLTAYTGNNIYTIDRWRTGGGGANGKIIVNDGYVTMERTAASLNFSLFQKINAEDAVRLSGQTVTLSAKVRTSSNYFRISIVANGAMLNSDTFNGTGAWQVITKTVTLPQTDACIDFGLSNNPTAPVGDCCDIEWIKVETGAAATPFVPTDTVTEWIKCRHYFMPVLSNDLHGSMIAAKMANAYMNFPAMRVTPTLSWQNPRLTIAGIGHVTPVTLSATIKNGSLGISAKTTEECETHQSCSITASEGDIVGYLDAEIY